MCGLLSMLIASCAEDKGSYDYAPENAITIGGLSNEYHVIAHEKINPIITPDLNFKISKTDDLSFSWQLDYQEICKDATLDVPIDAKVGTHTGTLIITDNASTLKYYASFKVYVETPYTYGLAVLSEAEDGTAKLSFQRREKDGTVREFLQNVFESENKDWGKMGENPTGMILLNSGEYTKSPAYMILNKSGDKALTLLDITTMAMIKGFPQSEIPNCPTPFSPSQIMSTSDKTLILANGRVITYNMFDCGVFNSPSNWKYDINWIDIGGAFNSYVIPGFDNKSKQFVCISLQKGHSFTYDVVTPFNEMLGSTQTDPVYLSDLTLVRGEKMYDEGLHYTYDAGWGMEWSENYDSPEGASTMRFIFKDSSGNAYFYTFDIEVCQLNNFITGDQNMSAVQTYGVTKDRTLSDLTLNDKTVIKALPNGKYWMIANNRDIRREYYIDGSSSLKFSLPDNVKGNITALQPNEDETKMYVGVYDTSYNGDAKGGIAVFNISANSGEYGKLLEYYPNVCCKPLTIIEKIK